MFMLKVHVLDKCPECKGQAYLPAGEAVSNSGQTYTRYLPCPICNGSGKQGRWVELAEFATLLQQATCIHQHVSQTGGFHLEAGEVWDDIEEVCDDCGINLDKTD